MTSPMSTPDMPGAEGVVKPLRVLDLFSGIGGFSLGLERTGGFKTVAFCEIEPFPRRVLAKHWPEVPCYDDVRTLTAGRLRADGIAVDVICGGFPCQDVSNAGRGLGLEGARSGLWSQIARLAGELRPKFVIVENVSALLGRGLDRVLGDLASLGYDAEWHCIPASAPWRPSPARPLLACGLPRWCRTAAGASRRTASGVGAVSITMAARFRSI
ncbi:DNA cytosine methyltransferase [Methylorubrum extorquens]